MNDIATLAESLEQPEVQVRADRCSVVRNRNSSCRLCVETCAYGALSVSGNELSLDAGLCEGCGACVVSCPTEAFSSLRIGDAEIDGKMAAVLDKAGGTAVFACARVAAKKTADPDKFVEVPCLPRIGEAEMLKAVAAGAGEVLLVDGNCSTCKYRDSSPSIDRAVEHANELLSAAGVSARARRVSTFPSEFLLESPEGRFGSTRRGFFSEAASAAKDTAMTAAKASLEERLGGPPEPLPIGERLRVSEDGTLPQLSMPRHDDAVNALWEIGAADGDEITSRLFGCVTIDAAKCNACGMCVTFCPTGALKRGLGSSVKDALRAIEFSASDCVRCGLCVDVCWKGALTLEQTVSPGQLFDFEPRVFELGQSNSKRSLFG